MYIPRTIRTAANWLDGDGAKLYTISTDDVAIDQRPFSERLAQMKGARSIPWFETAHFAIFHKGASFLYLIVCWWGNDNELFNAVSVRTGDGWIERSDRYSFCIYDLEVFWEERNAYIETIDCDRPSLARYRERRRADWLV